MGQKPRTLFLCNEVLARRGVKGWPQGGQTHARRSQPRAYAWPVSRPTRAPPTPPFRLFILHLGKTLIRDQKSMTSSDAAVIAEPILGVLVLFPAPYGREKSPPEAFFITMPACAPM